MLQANFSKCFPVFNRRLSNFEYKSTYFKRGHTKTIKNVSLKILIYISKKVKETIEIMQIIMEQKMN